MLVDSSYESKPMEIQFPSGYKEKKERIPPLLLPKSQQQQEKTVEKTNYKGKTHFTN